MSQKCRPPPPPPPPPPPTKLPGRRARSRTGANPNAGYLVLNNAKSAGSVGFSHETHDGGCLECDRNVASRAASRAGPRDCVASTAPLCRAAGKLFVERATRAHCRACDKSRCWHCGVLLHLSLPCSVGVECERGPAHCQVASDTSFFATRYCGPRLCTRKPDILIRADPARRAKVLSKCCLNEQQGGSAKGAPAVPVCCFS